MLVIGLLRRVAMPVLMAVEMMVPRTFLGRVGISVLVSDCNQMGKGVQVEDFGARLSIEAENQPHAK